MTEHLQISGSIRRRLSVQLIGSAAILSAIFYFTVLNIAQNAAEKSQDNILLASATSVMESVSLQSGEITVDIPYAVFSMLGSVSEDRVFYRILADGNVLTGYDDLPIAAESDGSIPTFTTTTYKGEQIRMVTTRRGLSRDGAPLAVLVSIAQTQNGQAEVLTLISRMALALGVGFFAFATGLSIWTARSSVRPLQTLAQSVSRRGPKDLRPVTVPVPSEMAPLVSSLNRFIQRLKTSLSRSEDFIAEAAHRVRTPLATVRTQAEVALLRVEKQENRQSLKEMIRAIDESSRAAGQLLDHAMVTFRTDQMELKEIDLTEIVNDLVERLRPVAELKDIALHLETSTVSPIYGDPILIQNAVRNLLDNAIKYSPHERGINVAVAEQDKTISVSIEDEAGGFPDTDTELLTQRFTRGENAAGTVGSGLGLTIAREVAEAHAGKLTITPNEKGTGACVSLIFSLP